MTKEYLARSYHITNDKTFWAHMLEVATMGASVGYLPLGQYRGICDMALQAGADFKEKAVDSVFGKEIGYNLAANPGDAHGEEVNLILGHMRVLQNYCDRLGNAVEIDESSLPYVLQRAMEGRSRE